MIGTHQRFVLVDSFIVMAGDTDLRLDSYLSCDDHIDYIGHILSAKLGMLCKACKVIPRESCLTLYNAMILPVLYNLQFLSIKKKKTLNFH